MIAKHTCVTYCLQGSASTAISKTERSIWLWKQPSETTLARPSESQREARHPCDCEANASSGHHERLSGMDVHRARIPPVTSADLLRIRQRQAQEEAAAKQLEAEVRAIEKRKKEEDYAARYGYVSPLTRQKRALQLESQPEDKNNELQANRK